MKNNICLGLGLFFVFAKNCAQNLIQPPFSNCVEIAFAVAGAALICYFAAKSTNELKSHFNQTERKLKEKEEELEQKFERKNEELKATIQENFKANLDGVCKISDKISDLSDIPGNLYKHAESIENNIDSKSKELFEELKSQFADLSGKLEKNANTTSTEIKDNIKVIIDSIEKLENKISETISKLNEIPDNLSERAATIGNGIENKSKALFEKLNEIPNNLYKFTELIGDDISDNAKEFFAELKKQFTDLSDALEDNSNETSRKIRGDIENITNSINELENNISKNIEKLGDQYETFKNSANSMINAFTQMSQSDNEIIRKIFGDD